MAYVNLYNPAANGNVQKLVRIGSFTYVLGWVFASSKYYPYLAKLNSNGNLIWQKRYSFPDTIVSGSVKTHFADIMEVIGTGDLILLVSDYNNFLVVKLTSEGQVIWKKKYYDRSDTQIIYTGVSANARLFKLNDDTLILKVHEVHSRNGGVLRINHIFYKINPQNGAVTLTRQITSQSPLLLIRDEEIRNQELYMFGFYDKNAAIIRINASLNITQSVGIAYNGTRQGFNYLHIYAASPLYNGNYAVLGSYYHYDPAQSLRETNIEYKQEAIIDEKDDGLEFILNERDEDIPRLVIESWKDIENESEINNRAENSNRFTKFFIAEVNADNSSVNNEKVLDKNFTATYQEIYKNSNGLFFSIYDDLYKLNSGLTNTDWVKIIKVQEISQNLVLNKNIGNTFDSYSMRFTPGKLSVASTGFDYDSCKTELVNDPVTLSNEEFSIANLSVTLVEYSPQLYQDPVFEPQLLEPGQVQLCSSGEPEPDLKLSTITANPTSIAADGFSTSIITVTLRDAQNNIINPSSYIVNINTNAGTWNGGVTTDGDGIYKRILRSSTTEQTATLTFSVDGIGNSPYTATVEFIKKGTTIEVSKITAIQSPYLYLQASGSTGVDSTKGRHLRWAFRGTLGEKHLPKGDYAVNYVNFNKPKDYVRIYKAAYTKKTITLNLITDIPEVVDHTNYLWIYKIENKEFYIRFGNTSKYNQVKQTINPLVNPSGFISGYGSELIEVENIKELFFAVTCNFSSVVSSSQFRVETLSVSTSTLIANKVVTNRKSISGTQLGNPLKLLFENGRSVRWRIFNTQLVSLDFEFYSETIKEINNTTGWDEQGDFALTLETEKAFTQLEPNSGDVDGNWHRFNEEALVNIKNYHHKWEATPEPGDRNIKEVVSKYIQLSEDVNNPLAIENISLENNPSDPEDYLEISNLDMLNFSANDYHIARMLGLGILDLQGDGSIKWVYVAEYFTHADLEDGLGKRDVQHLFMSLPTNNEDFRLPVPVELDQIIPGVFLDEENGDISSLTDENGYSHDGMSRYVSLYTEDLPEDDVNTPFFVSNEETDLSLITIPVYGGLKYRLNNGSWQKPELSNDSRYYNLVPQGDEFFETRFILIPEPLRPFYTHRQTVNGIHLYRSYGINWFSRAKVGDAEISIETLLKQKNPLVPPTNTNALLIRQESPLFLTSQEEQGRLTAISSNDKTLIRLTYDYHSFHELKNYNIPLDSPWTNDDFTDPINAYDPQVLFPDNEETFADEVDIFFRNQVPNNVTGKALTVSDHNSNEVLSVITTGNYEIVSTGETLTPYIAPGTESNYVGGVFISGDNQYIIHQVTLAAQGPVFTVYKKEISASIVNGGGIPSDPLIGELESPLLVSDGLFMVVENMQNTSSWGIPNPLNFTVKVGNNWGIHREVIETIDDDGEIERKVEKTRGIWGKAVVSVFEDEYENEVPGIYKVIFNNTPFAQHPQYNPNGVSVEWYKGIARIFTQSAAAEPVPNDTRKVLSVIRIDNIGTDNPTLIIQDPSFDPDDQNYDSIQTGSDIEVNFYPGYRVYFYENSPFGINEQNILPAEGEGIRYSIFGFRSRDTDGGCDPISGSCLSKIGVPCLMFAQELIEALPPELPEGPLYATRPDFFGRSTYTLTTKYQHKPHGVLFYRSNDEALLNALYKKDTIKGIRESLEIFGGNNEEYLTNRWNNFLNFNELAADGDYKVYPPADISPDGYKFPNPDKPTFFDWANHILAELDEPLITDEPGTLTVGDPKIIHFVKGVIYNAFVSLTEVPILYQYINGDNYKPVDKPQVIKDRNGHALNPGSEDFEMAPMMKIISTTPPHQTLFTDFKLDGTSNNLYFYGVKELSTQMNMSPFSPFLGPIKLVNTNAPEAPEIKRIVPVLENLVLGISPEIQLEINAFPRVQNVKKITIYRA
ncbi:MAG: Ig-like domain-containing protein, partial [Flavobacterium sp.]|nr:Ig-like domain-containing protein [Flavobacterium sp.]